MTEQDRRDLFRKVSRDLIAFAGDVVAKGGGHFEPTDAARMLLASGITVLSNAIGRAAAVEYLRTAATALEAAGNDSFPTLN